MSFRLLFAALAVAFVAVALLVWQPWTGRLEWTVYFKACGGTENAHPPPGYKNCKPQTRLRSSDSLTRGRRVIDPGRRWLKRALQPSPDVGPVLLVGVTTKPYHFRGQRRLVPVSANTTLHVDVDLALYAA